MQKALFSIETYVFDKVELDLSKLDAEGNINITFDPKGEFKSKNNSYNLSLTFIGKNENSEHFFFKTRCIGTFKFTEPIKFEEIPDFFYSNSIAILYPYLRAYISLITTQANTKGIILPTYNLSMLGNDLKKNTVEK